MRLTEKPCYGRSGATICTGCALLQMPADYTGSFPAWGCRMSGANKSEAREQQQLRAGFCRHEEGASQ